MMFTRREIILGGLLTVGFGLGVPFACIAQSSRLTQYHSCIISDSDASFLMDEGTADLRFNSISKDLGISGSGDKDFDFALAQTLSRMADVFDVLPGFAFFDDYRGENAYATTRVQLNRRDGTVLFGRRLLRKLLNSREHPEVAVTAVCAHEFAHIFQFKHDLHKIVGSGQATVKRSELQADFFAGYFAGLRKLDRPNFPAVVYATALYEFGDKNFDNPGHHGTHEERGQAVAEGFKVAYIDKRNISEAIEISINYVRRL